MTTLSSIGYGDMTPVTPIGRAVTVIVALIGVGIFAIPAGLLASAFTDQLQLDREAFKAQIMRLYEKGEPSPDDLNILSAEAMRLHISMPSLKKLIADVQAEILNRQNATFAHDSLVFNAFEHPEYAARQFEILVNQLDFLVASSNPTQLTHELMARFGEDSIEFALFLAMQSGVDSIVKK
jgi:hypothetical protein